MITPERIEQIVWLRYPKVPLEKTCAYERYYRRVCREETQRMLESGEYSKSLIKWLHDNDFLSL